MINPLIFGISAKIGGLAISVVILFNTNRLTDIKSLPDWQSERTMMIIDVVIFCSVVLRTPTCQSGSVCKLLHAQACHYSTEPCLLWSIL